MIKLLILSDQLSKDIQHTEIRTKATDDWLELKIAADCFPADRLIIAALQVLQHIIYTQYGCLFSSVWPFVHPRPSKPSILLLLLTK